MLTKKLFLYLILLLGPFVYSDVLAQNSYIDKWSKGRLMLTSDDTLKGAVNYNPTTDLLQINVDNTIKTFSAQQIASFDFFDDDRNQVRYYKVYPYGVYSNYKTPVFFEVLLEGPMTLLVRESVAVESVPLYDNFTQRTVFGSRTRLVQDFYFKDSQDKIRKYQPNKNELLNILKDKQSEIKSYMKEYKLRYNHKDDLIKIVDYYNQLKRG